MRITTALAEWHVNRVLRQERALVELPWSREVYVRTAIRFVAVIVCLVLWGFRLEPWSFLASIVVGWSSATGALAGMTRANAYKSGWLEGRLAMLRALQEAHRRGMTAEEWIQAQYDHDSVVMGLPQHRKEDEE